MEAYQLSPVKIKKMVEELEPKADENNTAKEATVDMFAE